MSTPGSASYAATDVSVLAGKWTYRSFNNDPALVDGDPNKALALFFAEAVFTFAIPSPTTLTGAIDWTGGGLDLAGCIAPGDDGLGPIVTITGTGRAGTDTEGWEYDYFGQLAHTWPNGVNQRPAIVGSVIRAKPHNGAPAGYVASFVAVKQS
jgi:hypothetical protein